MAARLHRYWFRFEDDALEVGVEPGCGVTAWTEEDALILLRDGPFRGKRPPKIAGITIDVDVASLDPGHVLPNMEPPNRRGVWFPRGFSLP